MPARVVPIVEADPDPVLRPGRAGVDVAQPTLGHEGLVVVEDDGEGLVGGGRLGGHLGVPPGLRWSVRAGRRRTVDRAVWSASSPCDGQARLSSARRQATGSVHDAAEDGDRVLAAEAEPVDHHGVDLRRPGDAAGRSRGRTPSSGCSRLAVGGMTWSRIAPSAASALAIPAAPTRWPTIDFGELIATRRPARRRPP